MGIARQSDGRELHLNIEHTKDQLGINKSKAEELHKRAFKLTSELSESVLKLNKLRSEKARQTKILNLLETSLPAFQDLKRQWINLQNFLEKIVTLVDATTTSSSGGDLELQYASKKQPHKSGALTNLTKKRLFTLVNEAYKVALTVENVSQTYVMISTSQLMPIVSKLGSLIVMSEDKEIEAKQRQIETILMQTTGEIKHDLRQKYDQFLGELNERENSWKKFFINLSQEETRKQEDSDRN